MVFNWFVYYLIKLHNYNSRLHWHEQIWERSQLSLGKHSAQLVGAAVVNVLDSYLLAPHVSPAAGIRQMEWRELVSLARWLTAV